MEDVTGKLIPVPKNKFLLSAPPEPPRTTQIREEIELICKAVSASELFELDLTLAIEHRIEVTSDKIISYPITTENSLNRC